MLNLTQRLILGCVLLSGLFVCLVTVTHRSLASSGQLGFAFALIAVAIFVAVATIFLVLRPLRMLARDAHRIAQGNLEHRVEWHSRDSFGQIAGELDESRSGCARCAILRPAAARWSFSSPMQFYSRSLSRSS